MKVRDTSSGLVSWCFSVVVDLMLTTHELLPMQHPLCSKQLRTAACLNLSHGDFCIRTKNETATFIGSTTLSQRERHGRDEFHGLMITVLGLITLGPRSRLGGEVDEAGEG